MSWYKKYNEIYNKSIDEIPEEVFQKVQNSLSKIQSKEPLVTIAIIAYNEEKNLTSCLWSLSEMKCDFPIELIGINNASSDKTEDVFKKLKLPYYNEDKKGCGFARQCGLNHSKGKYHITIDSDTIYPKNYAQLMINALEKKEEIVGVYSTWNYIPDENHSKFGIKIYTSLRNLYLRVLSISRPELCVRTMTFAFKTDLALKYGMNTKIRRGSDGALAIDLKNEGKLFFLHNRKAVPVTGYGTLNQDGSLLKSFMVRALKALKRGKKTFTKQKVYKDQDSNLIK